MPPFRQTLVLALFAFTCFAGCTSSSEEQTFHGRGVVKAIPPSHKFVNIDHETIPGFMDAMTMFFPVKDSMVLQGVTIDDSISFTIEINQGNAVVSGIEVIN